MNSTTVNSCVCKCLSNGLNVSILPQPQYSHTFVSCSVPYGSIHDIALAGTAHFLEHMMFYNPDGQPVKSLLHAEGASTSALTRYDVTTYQLACTGNLRNSLQLFMNMIATPYFTKENVERERAVIHQELAMYKDEPSWLALQQLLQMMYGNGHPIILDVAGTPESITDITVEWLENAYKSHYLASRMSVAVVGPVEPTEIFEWLENFSMDQPQIMSDTPFIQSLQEQDGTYREMNGGLTVPLVRFGFREESPVMRMETQVATMIGIEALFGETSTFYTESVKSGLLGKGSNWDHYYRQDFAFSNVCGYSVDPIELHQRVMEECSRIQDSTLSSEDIHYARMKWIGNHYADMDSLKKRCMHISEYGVIGLDYMKMSECAMKLTEEEIGLHLKRIAKPGELRMSVVR
jgi:predicted Zn-dependent peptidase